MKLEVNAGVKENEHVILDQAFEYLLTHPTADGMLALGWEVFTRFVGVMFQRAGYRVEQVALRAGSGADLVLYRCATEMSCPYRYVSVKHVRPPQVLAPAEVRAFGRVLTETGIPGVLVSATDLSPAAHSAANAVARLHVLTGDHLMRYIQQLPHAPHM